MKKTKKTIFLLLTAFLLVVLISGCSKKEADLTAFTYSGGIDNNGYWEGINALDYSEGFEYKGIPIPSDVDQVSDAAIQSEVDYFLSNYATTEQIKDRAVVNGDTVNIDYVGSVDGVEFAGGSTGGAGVEVTAGSTGYIDDFLTQIIGHKPGETFNVEVTFPDEYQESSLEGKDAVFVTTINFIVSTVTPDLTDEFVATTFSNGYGWTTVAEMKEYLKKNIRESALQEYIMSYIISEATVSSIPEQLLVYQKGSMRYYYQTYANSYGMELNEFLNTYVGVASLEEMLATAQTDLESRAKYSLVAQAIAEDAGISLTDEDVQTFFAEHMERTEYSAYEEEFGMPYLKQMVLQQKVLDLIIQNADYK